MLKKTISYEPRPKEADFFVSNKDLLTDLATQLLETSVNVFNNNPQCELTLRVLDDLSDYSSGS